MVLCGKTVSGDDLGLFCSTKPGNFAIFSNMIKLKINFTSYLCLHVDTIDYSVEN